jgi:hypothetical protein
MRGRESQVEKARKRNFKVAAGRKKFYLLAVPDCLRCAQYSLDDSVMAHQSRQARACRATWLCTTIEAAD